MAQTLISQVASLNSHQDKLEALGYTTAEQLHGVAQSAGPALSRYLDIDQPALDALLASVPNEQAEQAVVPPVPQKRRMGVSLSRIPRRHTAFAAPRPSLVPLPATVNLIAEMQPVRDQSQRGTCVAHAASAAAEHYWRTQNEAGGAPNLIDLSRQFLYWDCKQHDGAPTDEGTFVAIAMQQLQQDGCCLEATWPYIGYDIAGNEGQDPPPAGAAPEAATYKIPSYKQLSPTSVHDIKAELASGRCVAFSIPAFDSWTTNNPYVDRTGEIGNPLPNETTDEGHAMCFVGYEDVPGATEIGGGRFYLRNSWGPVPPYRPGDPVWAIQSVLGVPGYGTIPYSYIARYGSEAFSIG